MSVRYFSNTQAFNAWIYWWRNKLLTFTIIIIFSVSFLSIASPKLLFQSIETDFERHLNFYEHYSLVALQEGNSENRSLSPDEFEKLYSDNFKEPLTIGFFNYISVLSVQGVGARVALYLEPYDYERIMDKLGWELMEGSLPENGSNQVAITEDVAKNKGVSIGDKVGDDVTTTKEYLRGTYEVSGIMKESDNSGAILSYQYIEKFNGSYAYYIIPASQRTKDWLDQLQVDYPSQLKIRDLDSETTFFGETTKMFDIVNTTLASIVVIVVCLSSILINLIVILLRQREFGILLAVGYSAKQLLRRFFVETLIVVVIAHFLGWVLLSMLVAVINNAIFIPNAIPPINPLTLSMIALSLPLPLTILASNVFLFAYRISSTNTVNIIERR